MIENYSRNEWLTVARQAHLLAFGTDRPEHMDRADGVLLYVEEEIPGGFISYKEMDSETVYWQFGGVFHKGTTLSFKMYKEAVDFVKNSTYKQVTTRIENTNIVMLKFAMKAGFRITGVTIVNGSVMCELRLGLPC